MYLKKEAMEKQNAGWFRASRTRSEIIQVISETYTEWKFKVRSANNRLLGHSDSSLIYSSDVIRNLSTAQ